MKNGVLLLALMFGALMQCCLASIECYDCISDAEGDCSDPFDKDGVNTVACDGFCVKSKVKGKRKHNISLLFCDPVHIHSAAFTVFCFI